MQVSSGLSVVVIIIIKLGQTPLKYYFYFIHLCLYREYRMQEATGGT